MKHNYEHPKAPPNTQQWTGDTTALTLNPRLLCLKRLQSQRCLGKLSIRTSMSLDFIHRASMLFCHGKKQWPASFQLRQTREASSGLWRSYEPASALSSWPLAHNLMFFDSAAAMSTATMYRPKPRTPHKSPKRERPGEGVFLRFKSLFTSSTVLKFQHFTDTHCRGATGSAFTPSVFLLFFPPVHGKKERAARAQHSSYQRMRALHSLRELTRPFQLLSQRCSSRSIA